MYLLAWASHIGGCSIRIQLAPANTAAAISSLTSIVYDHIDESNWLLMISLSRQSQRMIAIPTCTGVRPRTSVLGRFVHAGAIPPGIDKLDASEGILLLLRAISSYCIVPVSQGALNEVLANGPKTAYQEQEMSACARQLRQVSPICRCTTPADQERKSQSLFRRHAYT